MNQKGQTIIILLLIMVVSLGIALSFIGRSNTEVSTASQTEASSRAFSAAEAGIESALAGITPTPDLTDQAKVIISPNSDLPPAGKPLEYPPRSKSALTQFWLSSPGMNLTPTPYFAGSSMNLYFGDTSSDAVKAYTSRCNGNGYCSNDKPAVSVNVIYNNNGVYQEAKYLFDSYGGDTADPTVDTDSTRLNSPYIHPGNNTGLTCDPISSGVITPTIEVTTNGNSSPTSFYCVATINGNTNPPTPEVTGGATTEYGACGPGRNGCTRNNIYPIMAVVRLLYTNLTHPIALGPSDRNDSLPPQAQIYTSTGTVGSVQRTIQVFQEKNVMPEIFNFVLFSNGDLQKNGL